MKYTFTFEEAEINTVLDALNRMPYGQVADLVVGLHRQAQAQIQAANPAPVVPTTPVKEPIKMEVLPKLK